MPNLILTDRACSAGSTADGTITMLEPSTHTHIESAAKIPAAHPSRHGTQEPFQEAVDPGYWPRAIGLRLLIAVCYLVLAAIGLLPMSDLWLGISGGAFLVYSLAMYATYVRVGLLRAYHQTMSPYTDTLIVTLCIVALARPEYPIWAGYFLIIPSLANFHSTRFLLGFAVWSIANCVAGFAVLDVTGRAGVSWPMATIISFMAVFTAMNADIIGTSNRKLRAMVREASLTDPLTGLANRRMFRQVLDAHLAPEMRPLAVLMYDVDNFKQINETRGHLEADTVLVAIAAELRHCFRDADVVARYGGDEIIVLAHVQSASEAASMGERSLTLVRERCGVTLSAGIAVFPLTARTLEAAVAAADAALLEAKHSGKARVAVARAA
ncbi:MAG: GGDEF domain-containing protein [Dehalococcoidia bacterium]